MTILTFNKYLVILHSFYTKMYIYLFCEVAFLNNTSFLQCTLKLLYFYMTKIEYSHTIFKQSSPAAFAIFLIILYPVFYLKK